MGNLRTDSTEDFPVESRSGGISYILVHPPKTKSEAAYDEDGQVVWVDRENHEVKKREYQERYTHYKATKTEKTSLLRDMKELNDYEEVSLLGVWTGRHRTDTHVLELPRFVERMEDAEL